MPPPGTRTAHTQAYTCVGQIHTRAHREATPRGQSEVCPGAAPHPLPPARSSLPAGAGPGPLLLSPPPPLGPPGRDTVSVTAAAPFISAAPAPPRPDGGGKEGGRAGAMLKLPHRRPPWGAAPAGCGRRPRAGP